MIFKYDGNSTKSGIYEIKNTITGTCYIGSAKRFKERWTGHSYALKNAKHQNKRLLASYRFHCEQLANDDFLTYSILEIMNSSTKEDRLAREEFWISEYLSRNIKLYNINLRPTTESITWASEKEKAQACHNSLERKNKNYEQIFGKEKSEQIKQRQSKAHRKRMIENPNLIANLKSRNAGANNPFYGKKHTEETRTKLSASQKGLSLEEKHGKEKATELREKRRAAILARMDMDPSMGQRLGNKIRGRTLEEIYGTERAAQIKEKRSKRMSKTYTGLKLIDPDGNVYTEIYNMRAFCEQHKLRPPHLLKLISGKLKSHHGWTWTR